MEEIKEQLISFDTAKLAKLKGFNIKTANAWADFNLEPPKCRVVNASELFTNEYYAPTQSLLQKWLREVHNIDVWAQPFVRNQSLPDESYSYFLYKDGVWVKDGVDFLDFEKALESGLQEALKLI